MKTLLRLLPLLALFTAFAPVATVAAAADDAKVIAAVRAADDERIAATKARDAKRLGEIYSNDLYYAHSNGRIDNKASQIEIVTTGVTRYQDFEHKDRTYTVAAPGTVISRGRVLIHMLRGTEKSTNDLNYLAVWRNENGTWRFLAWQSCKNPPADAVAPAKK